MKQESIFIVQKKRSSDPPVPYGSIRAIFDDLGEEEIGTTIRKVWGRIEPGNPVKTDKLTIYKTNVVRRLQRK